MNTNTVGKLPGVRRTADGEAVDNARDSLVATLAWMTANAITNQQAKLQLLGSQAPAESWRAPAGPMTPTRAGAVESEQPAGPLVADLHTEALGTIRVTIQRTNTGLSVVIGVRQEWSGSITESQRAGLEQALAAAGLTIASVTFVRLGEDGTAFALCDPASPEAATAEGTHMVTGEAARARPSKRKINTLG